VNLSVVHLTDSEAVSQNLPPALAETVPNLPTARGKLSLALVCTNFSCLPPVHDPETLTSTVQEAIAPHEVSSPSVDQGKMADRDTGPGGPPRA
jgi:hypothetical protein